MEEQNSREIYLKNRREKGRQQYAILVSTDEGRKKHNERVRKWRESNRDKVNLAAKIWRINNPERSKAAIKKWRDKNHEYAKEVDRRSHKKNIAKSREWKRKWREKNREHARKVNQAWRKNNPDRARAIGERYRRNNPGKIREKQRKTVSKRLSRDIVFRIKINIRRRIGLALHGKNKSKRTEALLGCSIETFKKYIESMFRPGMSWENYGYHGWHLDHIKPCSLFNLADPSEQRKCFHYSNLQPMWAKDNIKKNNHYDGPAEVQLPLLLLPSAQPSAHFACNPSQPVPVSGLCSP